MSARLIERADAAIDDDLELGTPLLQAMDAGVIERRDVAVLLRAQALQPGFARVHDESAAAGPRDHVDEAVEILLFVLVVDADAALDGDRQPGACSHRRDAVADQLRLGHEAGAEPPRLHAVGRTADIEVDLVIAVVRADPRRGGKLLSIAAAELKRERMLDRREAEHARPIAV